MEELESEMFPSYIAKCNGVFDEFDKLAWRNSHQHVT